MVTEGKDMISTHCVIIAGRLPGAVVERLTERFDDVHVCRGRHQSVLECRLPDESALRGLLIQLWDVGARLLVVVRVAPPEGALQ